jgi:glycosyltransferase involved in cell wall biosynthesis
MDKQAPLFTVFTPAYNRAWSLPRVFNSLKVQTLKDFEWVIVDDGSTDNTKELVEQWQKDIDFSIVYQWQPNQGKHIAYNTVIKLAKGELFTSIDSDDEIIPGAMEIMAKRWSQVTEEQRKYVSGVMFLLKDQHGNIRGDKFPEDGKICDLAEVLLVGKIKGDKGGFMQTNVFKMYPFPESVKNVLVPEGVFIHQMSHDWKMICINEVLGIVWIDERADQDHLSNRFSDKKSYSGLRLSNLAILNYSARFFLRIPRTFLANTAHYTKVSLYLKIGLRKQWTDIKTNTGRILWLLTLPVGWFLYVKEK